MGAAFDKWLARSTTLRLLRGVLGETSPRLVACEGLQQCRSRRAYVAGPFTALLDQDHTDENNSRYSRPRNEENSPKIRRTKGRKAERLDQRMDLSLGRQYLKDQRISNDLADYRTLKWEADVDTRSPEAQRLVDNLDSREDKTQLWLMILSFRQRIDGRAGVRAVWNGMMHREYELPTSGNEADILWKTFVSAAVAAVTEKRQDGLSWLTDIIDHAKRLKERTGRCYQDLYRTIVLQLLKSSRPEHALAFSDQTHEAGLANSDALRQLAVDMISAQVHLIFPKAHHCFAKIYMRSQARSLYDICMDHALTHLDESEVLKWHQLFVTNGDFPSSAMMYRDDVKHLLQIAKRGGHEARGTHRVLDDPAHMPLTRENMSRLVGEVHGIQPRGISDAFVARMFATSAFPSDLVINGLHFLGVEVIGPLALREMAVRLATIPSMKEAMAKLKTKHIRLSNDVFCRLLRKLISDSEAGRPEAPELYDALLARDQHPEDYGVNSTQLALLVSFLERDNLIEARLTFETLSLAGQTVTSDAWNHYIQLHLRNGYVGQACDLIKEAQSQGVSLSEDTVSALVEHIMPKRRPSRRPQTHQLDKQVTVKVLSFLTRTWIAAEERGANIKAAYWMELLKQRGMLGHFNEVKKLILWLAARFQAARELERTDPKDLTTIYFRHKTNTLPRGGAHDLSHPGLWRQSSKYLAIFERRTQVAIFSWGFAAASKKNWLRPLNDEKDASDDQDIQSMMHGSNCEPWAGGLDLLIQLEAFGVQANSSVIRRAFKTRMWMLFGPGVSTRPSNEQARERNQLSLAHYVRHAVEIWDRRTKADSPRVDGIWQRGLLPGLDEEMLNDDPYSRARLILFLFGQYRPLSRSRSDMYWDVGLWINDMSKGGELEDRRSFHQRRVAFDRGRYQRSGLIRRRRLPPLYGRGDGDTPD